ncbi:MAG: tyrosine-type recombinase/integrase [Clostridiaceae bacterium]|nr:tyrosine-type recombinase/integrase [Clostridiaceae bacterium]
MATVKKHVSASGVITYYIRCYDGYDTAGRQIERSMTWRPSSGMSQKASEKELQRQIVLFEDQTKQGFVFDSSTRFEVYANRWLDNNRPPQLAPKTYERYKALLATINEAIGHIKLSKLQSNHLLAFYNNLREAGIRKNGSFASSHILNDILIQRSMSKATLAKLARVSPSTISAVTKCNGRISLKSAEKISFSINLPINKIFHITNSSDGLSEKTILHYHRLISAILTQATRDRLIPYNIADKNYTKAPHVARKEAVFLEDYEMKAVISLLNSEPVKWKTAVMLLFYSGMRRGELLGLEWKDIDFENRVIHISRTSQYISSMGIITKDTKNCSSARTIKLPLEAFQLLRDYKNWWSDFQVAMGNKWLFRIEVVYANGKKEFIDNDRLFIKDDSTPMNPDSLTDWLHNFVERNHLPKFSPHSLRHTNASLLIANGVSIPTVSKRLGHSNVSTTARIYSHAIQSADEIASNILSEKLNPINNKSP